jgi:hypothetical protein
LEYDDIRARAISRADLHDDVPVALASPASMGSEKEPHDGRAK